MATSLRKADSVTLIISPYHVGIRGDAVGGGPPQLLSKGLVSVLKALGVDVRETIVEPSIDAEGDIGRSFELFRQTSKLVTEARNASSFPIVVSGNCSASVGVHAGLSGSSDLAETEVGCVWFDAHDDFNVPDTITSGYFDGMPIATMAGHSWKALRQTIPGYRPMNLDRFVHCGLRDLNELEKNRVIEAGYPVIWGFGEQRVDFAAELSQVLQNRKHHVSMVHLDLDSLAPSVGQANKFEPTPGGLLEEDVMKCMTMLPEKVHAASLTVAGYDPRYDVDGNICRVGIGAISAFVQSLLNNGYLAGGR